MAFVAFPIYIASALCLSLQRDCLTKGGNTNTRAFSHLSLRVLFTSTITFGVE